MWAIKPKLSRSLWQHLQTPSSARFSHGSLLISPVATELNLIFFISVRLL